MPISLFHNKLKWLRIIIYSRLNRKQKEGNNRASLCVLLFWPNNSLARHVHPIKVRDFKIIHSFTSQLVKPLNWWISTTSQPKGQNWIKHSNCKKEHRTLLSKLKKGRAKYRSDHLSQFPIQLKLILSSIDLNLLKIVLYKTDQPSLKI